MKWPSTPATPAILRALSRLCSSLAKSMSPNSSTIRMRPSAWLTCAAPAQITLWTNKGPAGAELRWGPCGSSNELRARPCGSSDECPCAAAAARARLCIQQLDDVGLAAQAREQPDLVDEAHGRLCVAPLQPDALDGVDLARGRHHLASTRLLAQVASCRHPQRTSGGSSPGVRAPHRTAGAQDQAP